MHMQACALKVVEKIINRAHTINDDKCLMHLLHSIKHALACESRVVCPKCIFIQQIPIHAQKLGGGVSKSCGHTPDDLSYHEREGHLYLPFQAHSVSSH